MLPIDFEALDSMLKEKHISRRKLALAVGINESTMSTAFARKSGLSQDKVLAIAHYLDVSPFDLYAVPSPWHKGFDDMPEEQQREWYKRYAETEEEIDRFDRLCNLFDGLNEVGQNEAIKRIEEMLSVPKYVKGGGGHGNEA